MGDRVDPWVQSARQAWAFFPLKIRKRVVNTFRRQKVYNNPGGPTVQHKEIQCCPIGLALILNGDAVPGEHGAFLPTSAEARSYFIQGHPELVEDSAEFRSMWAGFSYFINLYGEDLDEQGHIDLERFIPLED